MENRDRQPTAERPSPEEQKPVIAAREDESAAKAQPIATVVQDEARDFKERAAGTILQMRRDYVGDAFASKRRLCKSLRTCVAQFSTLREIQEYMAERNGVDAESVKELYDSFVARSGDASGSNSYAVYSMICAKKRVARAAVVKGQAECFKEKALEMIGGIKRDSAGDAFTQKLCESLAACMDRFLTLGEIQEYMGAKNGISAESVEQLYGTILTDTGDVHGGQAYDQYSTVCAQQRREA